MDAHLQYSRESEDVVHLNDGNEREDSMETETENENEPDFRATWFPQVPTYNKYREAIRDSVILEILQLLTSAAAVTFVIYESYQSDRGPRAMQLTWYALAAYWSFLFVLRLLCQDDFTRRLIFIYRWESIVDYITILIVFVRPLYVIQVLRILRLSRLFPIFRMLEQSHKQFRTDGRDILLRVVFGFTCFVICGALIISDIDNTCESGHTNCTLPFHRAMYLMVVTCTTVGYGDFYPHTDLGRAFMAGVMIVAFACLPLVVGMLIQYMQLHRTYGSVLGWIPCLDRRHVILGGALTESALPVILDEFMSADKGQFRPRIVAVIPEVPNDFMVSFTRLYPNKVQLLVGAFSTPDDLRRARVRNAVAVILLATRASGIRDDMNNLLRLLSIRRHAANTPVLVQVIGPQNKKFFKAAGATLIICASEINLGLIAKAIITPGSSTLISNLVHTNSTPTTFERLKEDANCLKWFSRSSWLEEYYHGVGTEIYTSKLPREVRGRQFYELVLPIYKAFGILLIGLVESETVTLNVPPNTVITKQHRGIFLAQDQGEIAAFRRRAATLRSFKTPAEWQVELDLTRSGHIAPPERPTVVSPSAVLHGSTSVTQLSATIANASSLRNHILFCGVASGLYYLLRPLRALSRGCMDLQPIVILTDEDLDSDEWSSISALPNVSIVKGSSTSVSSLEAAGVHEASVAVVFARLTADVLSEKDEFLLDADSVLAYMTISHLNPKLKLLLEITAPRSKSVFSPSNYNRRAGMTRSRILPSYAAGRILSPSVTDAIMAQIYHNPYILVIVKLLVHSNQLELHPIPSEFVGQQFDKVFSYMSEGHSYLPIGLYRAPTEDTNGEYYVYTCPDPHTIIRAGDQVYVLMPQGHFKTINYEIE